MENRSILFAAQVKFLSDQLWHSNLLSSQPMTYIYVSLCIQTYKSKRGYKDSSVEDTANVLLNALDQPTPANVGS